MDKYTYRVVRLHYSCVHALPDTSVSNLLETDHMQHRPTNHDHLFASERLRLVIIETMTWLNLFLALLLLLTAPFGGAV